MNIEIFLDPNNKYFSAGAPDVSVMMGGRVKRLQWAERRSHFINIKIV